MIEVIITFLHVFAFIVLQRRRDCQVHVSKVRDVFLTFVQVSEWLLSVTLFLTLTLIIIVFTYV